MGRLNWDIFLREKLRGRNGVAREKNERNGGNHAEEGGLRPAIELLGRSFSQTNNGKVDASPPEFRCAFAGDSS
jgi:hypothetical protein